MYAHVKLFTISLHTFEIPDFVRFQSPEKRFSFSEPVRPLVGVNWYKDLNIGPLSTIVEFSI